MMALSCTFSKTETFRSARKLLVQGVPWLVSIPTPSSNRETETTWKLILFFTSGVDAALHYLVIRLTKREIGDSPCTRVHLTLYHVKATSNSIITEGRKTAFQRFLVPSLLLDDRWKIWDRSSIILGLATWCPCTANPIIKWGSETAFNGTSLLLENRWKNLKQTLNYSGIGSASYYTPRMACVSRKRFKIWCS